MNLSKRWRGCSSLPISEIPKEQPMNQPPPKPSSVTYLPLPNRTLANPFREGTKKARAFELYRAGGERRKLLVDIEKLGARRSTAETWVQIFNVYTRGTREAKKARSE
jgi:hypothetical protein